jgi:hypothetical protein
MTDSSNPLGLNHSRAHESVGAQAIPVSAWLTFDPDDLSFRRRTPVSVTGWVEIYFRVPRPPSAGAFIPIDPAVTR